MKSKSERKADDNNNQWIPLPTNIACIKPPEQTLRSGTSSWSWNITHFARKNSFSSFKTSTNIYFQPCYCYFTPPCCKHSCKLFNCSGNLWIKFTRTPESNMCTNTTVPCMCMRLCRRHGRKQSFWCNSRHDGQNIIRPALLQYQCVCVCRTKVLRWGG